MAFVANDLRRFSGDTHVYSQAVQQLAADVEALSHEMSGLQSMWTGEAHDALDARFQSDLRQLEQVLRFAQQYERSLNSADSEYERCESRVSGLVNAIRV